MFSRFSRGIRRFSTVPKVTFPNTSALINNAWISCADEMETLNPATEEVITNVVCSDSVLVDQAVDAARAAFYGGEYSKLSGYERGMLLNKLANLIEENAMELALLECIDNGKTLGEANAADLPLSIQCYRYYAGWADKIHGSLIHAGGPFAKGTFSYLDKEPVGVVGQIIPWNFPLLMQAWKLGPAIAAGCSVVLKTAPQTPLTANRVGELILEAGFPEGAINIVPGNDETGKLVSQHEGLDKIAFTGSTDVGRKIFANAAMSNNMKRVTLELGGKSPLIVCDDANIDAAIEASHMGLFLNQGQCCCASSRIFVQDSIYNEFVEKATSEAKKRVVTAGYEEGAMQGPQVSKEQHDKVLGYIKKGESEGATLMTGGSQVPKDKGYFVQPTVFADVTDDMTIAKEEIFGPVMSLMKFSDAEEVVARANNTEYGLAAGIFTKSFTTAQKYLKQIRAGTIWVNCYDVFDAALPFGGFKASGIGRELGEAGLEPYVEKKTVVMGSFD